MKKGFLLLLALFTGHVFGFQNTNNNTFVFLDLLMWQVREVSDGNWAQILGPSGTNQNIQFLDVPFKWKPGVRVGFGYDNKENPWQIQLYYTGYKTRGVNQANINSGEIHSAFSGNFYANNLQGEGISGPYYHHAGIQWTILYNTLDLEFGRTLKVDPLLDLRPFAGLKAGSIHQTVLTNWQDPYRPTTIANPTPIPITTFSSATETLTNNFEGIGPSFGLDTSWHLYKTPQHGFNLIGNFSGAFLWGRWRLADVYQNNTPVSISIKNDSLSSAATMAKGYLGLEWTSNINNKDLSIRLGYEGQVWFNQLQYYIFEMGKANDSLYLHGGVLDFRIHF